MNAPSGLQPDDVLPTAQVASGWFLVHAKPRQEAVALENLARQGYEVYLPVLARERIRRRQRAFVQEPLFPGYLFIQIDTRLAGPGFKPIRSTLGVRDFVRFGTEPARVDAELIAELQAAEAARLANPERRMQPGDRVQILDGPFAGLQAIFETEDATARCVLLLELLKQPVQLRIDPASIARIEP